MIFKSKYEKDFSLWFFSICVVNIVWILIKIIMTDKFIVISSNSTLELNKFIIQSQNIFEVAFFIVFVMVIPNYRAMWLVSFFTPILKLMYLINNKLLVDKFINSYLYNYAFLTIEIAICLTFYVYTISLGCYTRKDLLKPFCIKKNTITPS